MVTLGWKSLTESEPRSNGAARVVATPVEHQGIRAALRNAYDNHTVVPDEFALLLSKIR